GRAFYPLPRNCIHPPHLGLARDEELLEGSAAGVNHFAGKRSERKSLFPQELLGAGSRRVGARSDPSAHHLALKHPRSTANACRSPGQENRAHSQTANARGTET